MEMVIPYMCAAKTTFKIAGVRGGKMSDKYVEVNECNLSFSIFVYIPMDDLNHRPRGD